MRKSFSHSVEVQLARWWELNEVNPLGTEKYFHVVVGDEYAEDFPL
jgi:hypothetical protein